jgi:hypothetical protein
MNSKQLTEEVSITGYVRATEWDWQDDVIGISIEAHDDEEVVIDPNGLEEFLFHEVDREVEVTGIVEQDEDGTKHITVTSYKPLSESDVQEEDDFEFEEDYDLEQDLDFEEDCEPELDQEAFPIWMTERWGVEQ